MMSQASQCPQLGESGHLQVLAPQGAFVEPYPDRAAEVGRAGFVDFGDEGCEGFVFGNGRGLEGFPEDGFEGEAGRVAGDGEGVFLGHEGDALRSLA
jgi:hypothetical protein